jgi:hypothetical protein
MNPHARHEPFSPVYSAERMVWLTGRPSPLKPDLLIPMNPSARRSNLREQPELDRHGRIWVPRAITGMSRRRVVKAMRRAKVKVTA